MSIQVNIPFSPSPQFIPELSDKPYAPYFTEFCVALTNAVNINTTDIAAGISDPTTTTGDLLYRGLSGLTRLGIGSNNQVLSSLSGTPAWSNLSTLLGISGTNGKVLYWNGTSVDSLVTPSSPSLLTHSGVSGTAPTWSASASSGFVYGPASSIDDRIALFSLATGKVIKMSGVSIDSSNNITGLNDILSANELQANGFYSEANGFFARNGTPFSSLNANNVEGVRITSGGSASPNAWGFIRLSGRDVSGAAYVTNSISISGDNQQALNPQPRTLYPRAIVNASGEISSAGAMTDVYNVSTASRVSPGVYDISFFTPMASSTYACVVSPVTTNFVAPVVTNKTASGFRVITYTTSGGIIDTTFTFMVIGVQ